MKELPFFHDTNGCIITESRGDAWVICTPTVTVVLHSDIPIGDYWGVDFPPTWLHTDDEGDKAKTLAHETFADYIRARRTD